MSFRKIDAKYHIEVRDTEPVIVNTATGRVLPTDEPLILFRAQDKLVPELLVVYADLCMRDGSPGIQIDLIADTCSKFEQFAKAHPDRVKVPD